MLSNLITSLLLSVCIGVSSFHDHNTNTNDYINNFVNDDYAINNYFTCQADIFSYINNNPIIYLADNFIDVDYLNSITTNMYYDGKTCKRYDEIYTQKLLLTFTDTSTFNSDTYLYYYFNNVNHNYYREIGLEMGIFKFKLFYSMTFDTLSESDYRWFAYYPSYVVYSGMREAFIDCINNKSVYIDFSVSYNEDVRYESAYPFEFLLLYLSANRLPKGSINFSLSSWDITSSIGNNYFDLYFDSNDYNFHTDNQYIVYYGNFYSGATIYDRILLHFETITDPLYINSLGEENHLSGTFFYVNEVSFVRRMNLTEYIFYRFDYSEENVRSYFKYGSNHFKNSSNNLSIYSITLGVDLSYEEEIEPIFGTHFYTLDHFYGQSYLSIFYNEFTNYLDFQDIDTPFLPRVFTLMRLGFSGLLSLANAQILPGLTIGTFLFLPFFFLILFSVIRLFKR